MNEVSHQVTARPKILVVDDRQENLFAMATLLKPLDAEVLTGLSGNQALSQVLRHRFALILMDVQMPEMDGFETVSLIQEYAQSSHVPIIFVTAMNKEGEYISKGYQLGAVDYLFKPVNPDILQSKVKVFLDLYREKATVDKVLHELKHAQTELEHNHQELEDAHHQVAMSKAYVDNIIKSMNDTLVVIDADMTIRVINQATLALLGFEEQELIGQHTRLIFGEELIQGTFIEELLKDGSMCALESTYMTKDHRTIPVAFSGAVLMDDQGHFQGIVCVAQDITKRKQAEEELRKAHDVLELRVHERTAKLEEANSLLMSEIAERKRAEEDIRNLNTDLMRGKAELEVSNKELEAFSYSVAHDLRAPLRGIDGFCQAVWEDSRHTLDPTSQRYLQRAREASQRMAKQIDALLNLARLSRTELEVEAVDLTTLAQSVLTDLQSAEPERQVEWTVAEGLRAIGDTSLVRVALENLLGNAWKFTSQVESARIELGMSQHTSNPVYFVHDNGTGFDMAYADKLFMAFQRLHGLSEFPCLGIGLATVQRIIRLHNGRIWAESAVGDGATFFFTFENEDESGIHVACANS